MTAPQPVPRVFPRLITALVITSVGVNIIVAVVVGIVAVYALSLGSQNAANTAAIHAAQLESCRASNTARQRDVAIWNRLLSVTPAQRAAETPAARAEVAQLEHLVKVKDSAVNCEALYHAS